MESILADYPVGLLGDCDGPCVSLYQPTSRRHPDNQQDPIRFRNLVRSLEGSLNQRYPGADPAGLLAPLHALAADRGFWNHTLDGLAVFANAELHRVLRLQRPVPERAVASDGFHIKPLIRILQSADRYQILGINRQAIRLFEGNRDAIAEIQAAPEVPTTITDALGTELTDPHHEVATYGSGAVGPAMVHGHGGKKDEVDKDAERYFRAVDRAVLKHHSQPTGLPLLLAALPEYHTLFRRVSHNPNLLADGIDTHPDDLSLDGLRERAWAAIQPAYLKRLGALVEDFGWARSAGLGTDDIEQAATAAVAGRVATLLLEAERTVPGHFDAETGTIALDDDMKGADDVLDQLGENVLRMGGDVVVVPAARMPTRTGLAATFRY